MSDLNVKYRKHFDGRNYRGEITIDLDFEVLVDLIMAEDHGWPNSSFAKMILDEVKLQIGANAD